MPFTRNVTQKSIHWGYSNPGTSGHITFWVMVVIINVSVTTFPLISNFSESNVGLALGMKSLTQIVVLGLFRLFFSDVTPHIIPATVMKLLDWFHDSEAVDALTYVVTYLLPTEKAIVETKTFLAFTVLGLVVIITVGYARSPWRKLPPCRHWRLPILGNVLQLIDKTWLVSKDCKERFGNFTPLYTQVDANVCLRTGEVMYLDGAGQPIVIFNSLKPAFELLERRSANYSDRPQFIMAGEILNGGLLLALLRYDDR